MLHRFYKITTLFFYSFIILFCDNAISRTVEIQPTSNLFDTPYTNQPNSQLVEINNLSFEDIYLEKAISLNEDFISRVISKNIPANKSDLFYIVFKPRHNINYRTTNLETKSLHQGIYSMEIIYDNERIIRIRNSLHKRYKKNTY